MPGFLHREHGRGSRLDPGGTQGSYMILERRRLRQRSRRLRRGLTGSSAANDEQLCPPWRERERRRASSSALPAMSTSASAAQLRPPGVSASSSAARPRERRRAAPSSPNFSSVAPPRLRHGASPRPLPSRSGMSGGSSHPQAATSARHSVTGGLQDVRS